MIRTLLAWLVAKFPIRTVDIADSAITSAKIADGTIVDADISSSAAIALTKVAAGTFTAGNYTMQGQLKLKGGSISFNSSTWTDVGSTLDGGIIILGLYGDTNASYSALIVATENGANIIGTGGSNIVISGTPGAFQVGFRVSSSKLQCLSGASIPSGSLPAQILYFAA